MKIDQIGFVAEFGGGLFRLILFDPVDEIEVPLKLYNLEIGRWYRVERDEDPESIRTTRINDVLQSDRSGHPCKISIPVLFLLPVQPAPTDLVYLSAPPKEGEKNAIPDKPNQEYFYSPALGQLGLTTFPLPSWVKRNVFYRAFVGFDSFNTLPDSPTTSNSIDGSVQQPGNDVSISLSSQFRWTILSENDIKGQWSLLRAGERIQEWLPNVQREIESIMEFLKLKNRIKFSFSVNDLEAIIRRATNSANENGTENSEDNGLIGNQQKKDEKILKTQISEESGKERTQRNELQERRLLTPTSSNCNKSKPKNCPNVPFSSKLETNSLKNVRTPLDDCQHEGNYTKQHNSGLSPSLRPREIYYYTKQQMLEIRKEMLQPSINESGGTSVDRSANSLLGIIDFGELQHKKRLLSSSPDVEMDDNPATSSSKVSANEQKQLLEKQNQKLNQTLRSINNSYLFAAKSNNTNEHQINNCRSSLPAKTLNLGESDKVASNVESTVASFASGLSGHQEEDKNVEETPSSEFVSSENNQNATTQEEPSTQNDCRSASSFSTNSSTSISNDTSSSSLSSSSFSLQSKLTTIIKNGTKPPSIAATNQTIANKVPNSTPSATPPQSLPVVSSTSSTVSIFSRLFNKKQPTNSASSTVGSSDRITAPTKLEPLSPKTAKPSIPSPGNNKNKANQTTTSSNSDTLHRPATITSDDTTKPLLNSLMPSSSTSNKFASSSSKSSVTIQTTTTTAKIGSRTASYRQEPPALSKQLASASSDNDAHRQRIFTAHHQQQYLRTAPINPDALNAYINDGRKSTPGTVFTNIGSPSGKRTNATTISGECSIDQPAGGRTLQGPMERVTIEIPRKFHPILAKTVADGAADLARRGVGMVEFAPDNDYVTVPARKKAIAELVAAKLQKDAEKLAEHKTYTLNVPVLYHPWIRGPFGSTARQLGTKYGVEIIFPEYRSKDTTILIVGCRMDVELAHAKVKELYETKIEGIKRLDHSISDRDNYRLTTGPDAELIRDVILRDTDVVIQVLDFSDVATLYGHRHTNMQLARTKLIEKLRKG